MLNLTTTPLLEIAVFNFQSAVIAENAGADRIELCDNPAEGGTTPSYGYLIKTIETISIPVFPIIRPRGGDFLYSTEEWEIVLKDIAICKELGFSGIVTGSLQANGSVHLNQLQMAVDKAYPMQVTFHRAFDRVANPFEAMEQIINAGCSRILTSGGYPEVMEGIALLSTLVQQANNRIIIMPGSGVRSTNISKIQHITGAVEFHSSARIPVTSAMEFINPLMNENLQDISVDPNEIMLMKAALQSPNF
ncbi:MAG: copper homeostasis protein CutC [Chitinophagia bacterium]|nr:copper homeostasis protein CutC [Chitinophagia bacterium]